MRRKAGKNSRLYYNTATYASPTWVRISTRDTLAYNHTRTSEDVTAEDSAGEQWEQTILNSRSIEFEAFHDSDDNSVIEDLETRMAAGTPTEFAIANGDIATSGTVYRRLPDYEIHEGGHSLNVKEHVKGKFVCKPAPSANAPSTVTVS